MRLIDADALMREFAEFVRDSNNSDFADVPTWNDAVSLLESAPTIKERKKGKWVRNFDGNEWYWFCSNCKEEWYEEDLLMGGNELPNFCPNCGADMRESK